MTSQLYSVILFLLLVSCSNNADEKQRSIAGTGMDSIKQVDIMYFPAFSNSSVLHLDRKAGSGTFKVDTTIGFSYGIPEQKLSFSLSDMKAKTSIDRFWDEKFLQSLARDTTRLPNTDGLSLWIFYTDGHHKDSVNLGNDYPPRVDSIIVGQLNYINEKTKDTAMKAYIKQVKEYL